MRILAASVLLVVGFQVAFADGPAHLLKDINQTLAWDEMSSFPGGYHRLGGTTLFRARTRETGVELWRTDGTEAGTWLVRDIGPGRESGARLDSSEFGTHPFDPAHLGGDVLFPASDGVHGWELWKSDGTEAGTSMVKEIRTGTAGPFDGRDRWSGLFVTWTHVDARGLVYFLADDGEHGFELWRTDGTEAGTFMLKDIRPGAQSPFGARSGFSFPGFEAIAIGNRLYFRADDGVHGNEVWLTDGTSAGTQLLKDIAGGAAGSGPVHLLELDGKLIFWADPGNVGAGLWRSNGTAAGTVQIRNHGSLAQHAARLGEAIVYSNGPNLYRTDGTAEGTRPLAVFGGAPAMFEALDGRLALAVSDGVHGVELWTSDGSVEGTTLARDIRPGPAGSGPAGILSAGGRLFFLADDGVHGYEVWTSDGTEQGTRLVLDIGPGAEHGYAQILGAGGLCYVRAYENHLYRLWATDGTEAGTRQLGTVSPGDVGDAPDGTLLFGRDDSRHGVELWKTDGTDAGTVLVKDVNPLVRTRPSFASVIGSFTVPGEGERFLVSADDDVHGVELWVTDGSAQGTRLLKDINPGPGDSYPQVMMNRDGFLYLLADDGVHGRELWRTDGTEAGTTFVEEIGPGPGPWLHSPLFDFRGEKYFVGLDEGHGYEIWKTDLTAAGTRLAFETIPGPDSSLNDWPFVAGDTLYFLAWNEALNDSELWKSDGTQAGTKLVRNGVAGDFFFANDFAPFGNSLFMTAFDFDHGWEPWISDGTEAGTRRLLDINPGEGHGLTYPSNATEMNGFLYFAADDGLHGQDLWRSDGTEAGTTLLEDVRPGFTFSGINHLVAHDGTLYFTAGSSSFHTWELWKSDGTERGTVQIAPDLGAFPYGLDPVPGGLLFAAWDPDHGYELWRSDGTTEGTALTQDIATGPLDSRPQRFRVKGSRTFFLADDGFAGYELWVARTAILMNRPAQAIQDLRGDVVAIGLSRGLAASLLAPLDTAARALQAGRSREAITALDAFAQHAGTLTPRWMSESAAANLREFATETIRLLRPPLMQR